MSASIYFQPVKGKRLDVGAPSSFLELLRRVLGGDQPWLITDHRVGELRIAAAATEHELFRAALEEMAEAAMKHGEIRVWAEY